MEAILCFWVSSDHERRVAASSTGHGLETATGGPAVKKGRRPLRVLADKIEHGELGDQADRIELVLSPNTT